MGLRVGLAGSCDMHLMHAHLAAGGIAYLVMMGSWEAAGMSSPASPPPVMRQTVNYCQAIHHGCNHPRTTKGTHMDMHQHGCNYTSVGDPLSLLQAS
jgi:hypothetical protein